ncbi:MAG: hypothetical protein HGA54_00940 [Actinobacteria bacterium]|nr:hypothetical protein [Actinomycetota bacterium]
MNADCIISLLAGYIDKNQCRTCHSAIDGRMEDWLACKPIIDFESGTIVCANYRQGGTQ